MEPLISSRPHRRHLVAALAAVCAPLAACESPPTSTAILADWCWAHYDLAPAGALVSDSGPDSASGAAAWDTWLGQTADAPTERREAHRAHRELIDELIETGTWNDAQRALYEAAAESDPTPSTLCETVGARILVDDDGSLPPDWQERFRDPDDPAYSPAAMATTGTDGTGAER